MNIRKPLYLAAATVVSPVSTLSDARRPLAMNITVGMFDCLRPNFPTIQARPMRPLSKRDRIKVCRGTYIERVVFRWQEWRSRSNRESAAGGDQAPAV